MRGSRRRTDERSRSQKPEARSRRTTGAACLLLASENRQEVLLASDVRRRFCFWLLTRSPRLTAPGLRRAAATPARAGDLPHHGVAAREAFPLDNRTAGLHEVALPLAHRVARLGARSRQPLGNRLEARGVSHEPRGFRKPLRQRLGRARDRLAQVVDRHPARTPRKGEVDHAAHREPGAAIGGARRRSPRDPGPLRPGGAASEAGASADPAGTQLAQEPRVGRVAGGRRLDGAGAGRSRACRSSALADAQARIAGLGVFGQPARGAAPARRAAPAR